MLGSDPDELVIGLDGEVDRGSALAACGVSVGRLVESVGRAIRGVDAVDDLALNECGQGAMNRAELDQLAVAGRVAVKLHGREVAGTVCEPGEDG